MKLLQKNIYSNSFFIGLTSSEGQWKSKRALTIDTEQIKKKTLFAGLRECGGEV